MWKFKPCFWILMIIICCLVICLIICLVKTIIRIWCSRHYVPQFNSPEQVAEFNNELYPSGFAYDPQTDIFYSLRDAWQRQYGYRRAYDEMAARFNMIIDCEPIKFWYNGRYWMIELWKGQYGLSTGAEVGIYVSDDGRNYRCVEEEDEITMGFVLMKGDKVLAQRYERHWWLTAFVLGEYSKTKDLSMIVELNLANMEMCLAVNNELRRLGYNGENFTLYRNSIRIKFDRPYKTKKKSRKSLAAWINNKMNKHNCKIYCRYTKRYIFTLDKIQYIRIRIPHLYNACLQVLKIWKKIND